MGNVRCTIFFTDYNNFIPAGWSETHFLRTADVALDQAILTLQTMAIARQQLLAQGIAITYLRVSQEGVFRDSQIRVGLTPLGLALGGAGAQGDNPVTGQPLQPGAQGQVPPNNPILGADPADMPWTAVLVRGEGPTPFIARSMFWLSGLPDNITWAASRGITDPVWLGLFNTWSQIMTTTFGFQGQDNSAANPFKQINAVLWAATTNVSVTCPNHGFTTGQMVGIRGVKTLSNLGKGVNKIWQVIAPDNNTLQLIGSATIPSFTYLSGGTAQLRKIALIPYAKLFQRRYGSRKRGRPFGLLTGRRRVKRV